MGHQVIEFRDNMIESSRTLEYHSSSHSFARNTAREMRGQIVTWRLVTQIIILSSNKNIDRGKLTASSRMNNPPLPGVPIP